MKWLRLENAPNNPAFVNPEQITHLIGGSHGGCYVYLSNGDCVNDPDTCEGIARKIELLYTKSEREVA